MFYNSAICCCNHVTVFVTQPCPPMSCLVSDERLSGFRMCSFSSKFVFVCFYLLCFRIRIIKSPILMGTFAVLQQQKDIKQVAWLKVYKEKYKKCCDGVLHGVQWDWLSMREDSIALILLSPTTSTGLRGYPRTVGCWETCTSLNRVVGHG